MAQEGFLETLPTLPGPAERPLGRMERRQPPGGVSPGPAHRLRRHGGGLARGKGRRRVRAASCHQAALQPSDPGRARNLRRAVQARTRHSRVTEPPPHRRLARRRRDAERPTLARPRGGAGRKDHRLVRQPPCRRSRSCQALHASARRCRLRACESRRPPRLEAGEHPRHGEGRSEAARFRHCEAIDGVEGRSEGFRAHSSRRTAADAAVRESRAAPGPAADDRFGCLLRGGRALRIAVRVRPVEERKGATPAQIESAIIADDARPPSKRSMSAAVAEARAATPRSLARIACRRSGCDRRQGAREAADEPLSVRRSAPERLGTLVRGPAGRSNESELYGPTLEVLSPSFAGRGGGRPRVAGWGSAVGRDGCQWRARSKRVEQSDGLPTVRRRALQACRPAEFARSTAVAERVASIWGSQSFGHVKPPAGCSGGCLERHRSDAKLCR